MTQQDRPISASATGPAGKLITPSAAARLGIAAARIVTIRDRVRVSVEDGFIGGIAAARIVTIRDRVSVSDEEGFIGDVDRADVQVCAAGSPMHHDHQPSDVACAHHPEVQ